MEIDGKIILDLGMQQGMSKAGREWKKKEWVLETFGPFFSRYFQPSERVTDPAFAASKRLRHFRLVCVWMLFDV